MINILKETKRQKLKLEIMIKWISRYQNIAENERINTKTKRIIIKENKLNSKSKYIIMKSIQNMEIKNIIK